ncbi:MAG: helix-turn-helix transcriptional regulator [Clostridiales bacterium]|nr:helix-turn-helix transcriptional regulator [Clostridiales bacterium]
MQKTFGDLRREAGFDTQEKFCASSGYSRSAVAKWEVGRSFPRASALKAVAALLGVTADDILTAIYAARQAAQVDR